MGQFAVDDDSFAMQQAKRNLDKKVSEFEQSKKRLYRPDGTSKYAPVEHNEQVAALLEPVKKAVAEAQATAEQVRARCDEEVRLKDADPLLALTEPSEREEVTFKQSLIESDALHLPLPTLAQRLDAIALHGSKVETLLYARFGRRRVEELQGQIRGQERTTGFQVPEGYSEVIRALTGLEAKMVDPKLQAQLKKSEEKRKASIDLQMYASRRLGEVDGSAADAQRASIQFMRSNF